MRPLLNSKRGIILASGITPSYSEIDSYKMAACAIDTAIRAAVAAGADAAGAEAGMIREPGWHTAPTFGGTALTSRRSGKRIAATDHCCAIVRTCQRCYSRYVATPDAPHHGCAPTVADATFGGGDAIEV